MAKVAATKPTRRELPVSAETKAGMMVVSESNEMAKAKVAPSTTRNAKFLF
jgi:hypothetical protein